MELFPTAAVLNKHKRWGTPASMDVAFSEAAETSVALPCGPFDAPPDPTNRALCDLGLYLKQQGYRFTTISPASHSRFLARERSGPCSLEDILGWNRTFSVGEVASDVLRRLTDAGILELVGSSLRSVVRFSTLDAQTFVHSSFPTEQPDSVFFGPDTYRFARFVDHTIDNIRLHSLHHSLRILDMGAGSGAGGLHAAARAAQLRATVTLADINPHALRFCEINATLNAVANVTIVESDLFERITGPFDLIIANPPYLVDALARTYRHGGGPLGYALSLRIAREGLSHLAPGGRLLLYTGSAIVNRTDLFKTALSSELAGRDVKVGYEEIDPDVFGEELERYPYDRADRIAVVGVTIDIS